MVKTNTVTLEIDPEAKKAMDDLARSAGRVGATRDGWRTSEFRVAIMTLILISVGAWMQGSDIAAIGSAVGSALVSAGYAVARTMVKRAELSAPADVGV